MTPAGRPHAVRRFVRRPLWWVVIAAVAVAWIHLDDVASSRARDRALDDGPRVTAEVGGDYDGSEVVPVAFEHPAYPHWGTIRTAFRLNDVARAPDPGDAIPIDISNDDPTDVALAGDRHRATDYLGFDLGLVAIPVVFFAGRWFGVRRTRRLMAAPGPSFSMLGLIRCTGRLRPRAVLDLMPLDSAPGAPPLCSVPLLHTGALPLERSYTLELKGSPRPLGRVVARASVGTVLWPRGRASPNRPSARNVPAPVAPPVGAAPVANDTSSEPSAGRSEPLRWPPIRETFPPLLAVALAGAVAFGLMVTVVTVANAAAAARTDRSTEVVPGTVVADGSTVRDLTVAYRPDGAGPDDDDLVATIVVDDPDLFVEDGTVALRVDPENETHVRLASQPYGIVEPLVWGWLPAGAVGAVVVSWLVVRRRNRRAARSGWRPVDGWRVPSVVDGAGPVPGQGPMVAVAFSGAPTASCVVRVSDRHAGRWPSRPDRPAGDGEVLVAGTMSPGDPIAVRVGDWAEPGLWVAEAAPAPEAVERPSTPLW